MLGYALARGQVEIDLAEGKKLRLAGLNMANPKQVICGIYSPLSALFRTLGALNFIRSYSDKLSKNQLAIDLIQ